MAVTPNAADDPRYAAVAAALEGQVQAARRNAEIEKQNAATNFAYQQALLQREKPQAERRLQGSLLSRGVFRSGQAQRKAGELESDFMLREATARNAMASQQTSADQRLSQTLGDVEGRRATEAADAVGRLNEAARLAEERARAVAAEDRRIKEQQAAAEKAAQTAGLPTYEDDAAYAAAAQAYADAVARNEAAAAQAAAAPPAAARRPAATPPRRTPAPAKPPLRPLVGRF